MQRRTFFILSLLCLCAFMLIAPSYAEQAMPQAEEAIALVDILKPSGDAASGVAGGFNYGMLLFNTLFVIGLGVIVMKQPWFKAWADRVKENIDNGQTPMKAMWAAFKKTPTPSYIVRPPTPAKPANGEACPLGERELNPMASRFAMTNLSDAGWVEHLDSTTLVTGTILHWIKLRGEEYVLTETENHSQWLKLDTGETLSDQDVLTRDMIENHQEEAPIQQLPDYLDADIEGLPVKLGAPWPIRS